MKLTSFQKDIIHAISEQIIYDLDSFYTWRVVWYLCGYRGIYSIRMVRESFIQIPLVEAINKDPHDLLIVNSDQVNEQVFLHDFVGVLTLLEREQVVKIVDLQQPTQPIKRSMVIFADFATQLRSANLIDKQELTSNQLRYQPEDPASSIAPHIVRIIRNKYATSYIVSSPSIRSFISSGWRTSDDRARRSDTLSLWGFGLSLVALLMSLLTLFSKGKEVSPKINPKTTIELPKPASSQEIFLAPKTQPLHVSPLSQNGKDS